ncbi:MAG: hypothetical protein V1697_02515 [Candidatus Levyibacteriota bacterium]
MTATGHAVIGAVIAAKIGNPALAIPIAFTSHIVADMVPHWDPATNRNNKGKARLLLDSSMDVFLSFAIAYLLTYYLFPETSILYLFLIVGFSQLLDWLTAPYYFFNINLPPFNWSYHFQKKFDRKLDKPWGIITQAVVVITIVFLAVIY